MIHLLDPHVINQIAAGEVVENPASAVKELVENAIDAGASRIEVEVEGGGHALIRVRDDGCGMGRSDAETCLLRYATSKIQAVEDLDRLSTMGFRGEALAAIASVSHLSLETSNGKETTRILSEGGKILEIVQTARNRGTTLEIRSLFFNAPARRKFQKGGATSQAQVTRLLETLALAHPEISFSLKTGSKTLLEVDASSDWQMRARELGWEGKRIETARVRGLIGEAQATRSGQLLYINRRPIVSPLVARAVKEGMGTRIAESQYPKFLLFLDLDPRDVDVNVHPQKREVRFREESEIFLQIKHAVMETFEVSIARTLSFSSPAFQMREEMVLAPSFTPPSSFQEPLNLFESPEERFLALVGPYLLLEDSEGVLAVDLRALAGKLLQKNPESEPLLWPLEIEIEQDEELISPLQAMGVEARMISDRKLAIDALPVGFSPDDFPLLLKAARGGRPVEWGHSFRTYSRDEALHLWCKAKPYGPPLVRLNQSQLERLFT